MQAQAWAEVKPGFHCDIRINISTSTNMSITNVHTCCISTRKVAYASTMSSRMKPWENRTRHVLNMAGDEILLLLLNAFAALQMPGTFLPTIFLSRLHLFLRLVNQVFTYYSSNTKGVLFVTLKSSKPGFVAEAGIIANCLGKFLIENSILKRHFGQYYLNIRWDKKQLLPWDYA